MIKKLFLLRKVFILTLILSCVFSSNILYSAENINDYIMEEITDNTEHPFYTIPIKFGKYVDFDFKITKHIILVTLAGILSVCSMKYLSHKLKRPFRRPTYLQSILEGLIDYMNKDVIGATLGEEGKKYVPFCLTIFLFVLFSNILGLIPASIKVPTQDGQHAYIAGGLGANIGFTAAIALIVFIVYIFAGIRKKGIIKYWTGLVPKGLPIPLIPIIWVLEFITLFNRAFALAIRLFANITGGHIMMIVIPYLIIMSGTLLVSPFAVLFLGFIYVLEMFVSVLQAYIFSLLSAVYIGIAISDEH
ncbi:F0F1 ATP synthase subunit A [Brachyspira hampsonii]|uniref:ATP synthase subunit a n=1 Tax=Brachyspira hampsonii 30446 TaxID=1289135 RepID=A0A2U4F1V9_9SPIR|nr:F0F1 ATP synthase subunit A [Brachyspira hampsonii]EKV57249.1 F0F1-type ATP synthase subunit A [Brachyspira hampsonii 30446]MBW5390030.1 ATP synthase F0 subunit A [Brachyspira hampsonii]MBW5394394.1 ATP synthase F0 subunit A [Brachyspira hampsonii]OEJ17291.1 ATP synthase F0 subunit A [Brachyspira hampsonii]